MPSRKPCASEIVCAMTVLMLTGCAKGSAGDFCHIYQPVYTTAQDSDLTRDQADVNNAVWWEKCR